MRTALLLAASLALALANAGAAVPGVAAELPPLEFEHYELPNGLDVILHVDHSTPIVGVNVWYHVGSKNEKPGRTGFAHLFEHMMFQGSQHYDNDYFLPLQNAGGQVNGSTTEDRTNYWENVPSDQLELALFLEADRMGYLVPAMTEEKLANQRDVVKNEKRQGDNQPYAKAWDLMPGLLFPGEHPYSWTVIGSMEDLSAASLEDVSEFFRRYYAPNNASLAVAGDFDLAQAKAMIEKYFAGIPSGPAVDRLEAWVPRLDGERRFLAEDAVEMGKLIMAWHMPGNYQPGDAELELLSSVLATGKTSRLYKRLVYDRQIAQEVEVYVDRRELSSIFMIEATARDGVPLERIEAVIDEELAAVRSKGVTKDELSLAKVGYEGRFLRSLQRVGAWGGKADVLNKYNTFLGDPGRLQWDLDRHLAVTPAAVQRTAAEYLGPQQRAVLEIVAAQKPVPATASAPASELPGAGAPVSFSPPALEHATLANGLELYLVEKHELPLV
ncbi:MAG: insulinase family protein, partial [Gemmatimonadales bacterium]